MIGQFRPALHAFRAFDNRPCFAFGSAVGDALMFTQTAAFRIDLFAVYAFMHDYRITRRGHLRGLEIVANGCSASPHAASLPVGLTWYSNFIAESPYSHMFLNRDSNAPP
mgnify:CR=1 FL=1